MAEQSYHQFCPVAMASELLCTRWTIVVLRELLCGPARFNELRRGMPRMSPALLTQRLRELEDAGVLERRPAARDPGATEYVLTDAGQELRPIVEAMGCWGQRWVASELSLEKLDATLLMWDMRRNLVIDPPPPAPRTIHFTYPDAPAREQKWWLVIRPDEPVDLCSVDPGSDIDLFVRAPLAEMTAIWMGHSTIVAASEAGRLTMAGDERLAATIGQWLRLSPFAGVDRMVA
ncbi:HxlR family transcriptional regulator [Novosphingobium kunmingense]|uniref:HxlR family transcriptional regulator n=1 Tax=Novosphingobium kunmingense TaxID=1211806 RepID=A0A2N0HJX4_9SPHN|nr:helix-turn-helix domain-containing protein [Novosphingobium kunmingense]PKB19247.1 HxlR family transcriptional regulator [Novosphingobium kunmingense]